MIYNSLDGMSNFIAGSINAEITTISVAIHFKIICLLQILNP